MNRPIGRQEAVTGHQRGGAAVVIDLHGTARVVVEGAAIGLDRAAQPKPAGGARAGAFSAFDAHAVGQPSRVLYVAAGVPQAESSFVADRHA